MKVTFTTVLVASLMWFCVAFALDRYALLPVLPWATDVATIKIQIKWPLGNVNFPKVGLAVLVGVPLFALAICCAPRQNLRSRGAWLSGFQSWSKTVAWLLVWCAMILIGQVLYLGLKKVIPEGLCNIAEAFELQGTLKIFGFELADLKGSGTALLGLVFGSYLFLRFGIRDTLNTLFTLKGHEK